MKSKFLSLLLISFLSVIVVNGQTSTKKSPVGTWKFEAPYAPEAYTSGSIIVSFVEKNYTAAMLFTGNELKITGNKVKFENDSLFFSAYIEGQDVAVSLKLDGGTKMSGKAVYSEGEVPLTLTKVATAVEAKKDGTKK